MLSTKIEYNPNQLNCDALQMSNSPTQMIDYVYFIESEIDSSIDDSIFYIKAIQSEDSEHCVNAIKEEIKSMDQNQVWDLIDLPHGSMKVGYKWIFEIKHDSKGNIKRIKARLVAKDFTQKVLALVAHCNYIKIGRAHV